MEDIDEGEEKMIKIEENEGEMRDEYEEDEEKL